MTLTQIGNETLKAMVDGGAPFCLLDVRSWPEYQALGVIPGATLMPIDEVMARLNELDKRLPTVVICEHGVRSAQVAAYLHHMGFAQVLNHEHGMHVWDGAREFPQ